MIFVSSINKGIVFVNVLNYLTFVRFPCLQKAISDKEDTRRETIVFKVCFEGEILVLVK